MSMQTSSAATSPTVTVSTNPATGEVIAEYPLNTVEDVTTAVKNARLAQPAWQALPLKNRKKYVLKFAEYIQKHSTELAETISKDNGKTVGDAMFTEVMPAALATGYYCKNAARFLKDRKLKSGNIMMMYKRSRIVRVPYGVVAIISPWNYPFSIPFSEVVMALLAGNTVILKTASETQAVGHALKACVEYAGLPEHVFTYVNLPGSKAGDALIDAGVDKLFFTGSVPAREVPDEEGVGAVDSPGAGTGRQRRDDRVRGRRPVSGRLRRRLGGHAKRRPVVRRRRAHLRRQESLRSVPGNTKGTGRSDPRRRRITPDLGHRRHDHQQADEDRPGACRRRLGQGRKDLRAIQGSGERERTVPALHGANRCEPHDAHHARRDLRADCRRHALRHR